ncbi:hypothetical protein RND71_036963 [Anisodus tanguticus]|uniref:RRM domain-containing protein n=1 Tax=Anisodus tanguticus TaxID=243964 RepID=A0AAE1V0B5_9SOLA|nr:hypothetical protein RND71_036963 [Anisodus tanguticus]
MSDPSMVIHVRNVGHEIAEALLQMQDVPSAVKALQFYTNVQPSIRGRNVYVQFSSHQELTTMDQNTQGRGDELHDKKRVASMIYSFYSRSNQKFSPYGHVLNQDEAFVLCSSFLLFVIYFSLLISSLLSLLSLCCSAVRLSLDSQPNRILLVTTHHMLYPITVDVLPQVFSPHGFVEKIVTFQKSAGQHLQVSLSLSLMICFQALIQYQVQQSAVAARNSLQMGNAEAIAAAFAGGLPPGISGTNYRCTLLVSNLNSDRINEDKLFNVCSLYGNIVRIKILHNKPDHALVQMGDGFQAELAVHFLKGAMLFEKRLEVNFSKHPNITTGPDTHDYLNSNLNRFNRNAAKNYRYCCSPTKMMHLSSMPQDVTEAEIVEHLEEHGPIINSKLFEMNGKQQALVLFEKEEQATEALVCKNATSLGGSTIRISFSQLQSI